MDTFQPSATLGPRTCCGCCRRRAGGGVLPGPGLPSLDDLRPDLRPDLHGRSLFGGRLPAQAQTSSRPRGGAWKGPGVRSPARLPGPLPASDATPRQAGCPGLACAPSRSRTAAPPASSGLLPCAVSAGCAPHPREEPSTAAARWASKYHQTY